MSARIHQRLSFLISLLLSLLIVSALWATIEDTRHNLSVSGPGSIKAVSEQEICVFCHTPHNAGRAPLWNRGNPGRTYTLYSSSTLNAVVGQPDGSSLMCLSCHDGTIALGHVNSRTSDISFGGSNYIPSTNSTYFSTDLTDDHPISFTYDAALASTDGELNTPSTIHSSIHLDNGKMQCTSCHDAHGETYYNFLRLAGEQSVLCMTCHNKTGWTNSIHYTSTATWNQSGTDPWFHTPDSYNTVQKNGCENCHNPHGAGYAETLLNFSNEEDNCLVCHNSNVAQKDLTVEFTKAYKHSVVTYSGVHETAENIPVQTRHVECADCHNPHQVSNATATAPNVNGRLVGVRGINTDGSAVASASYEYEICYKCHAESPWRPAARIPREIEQNNVRLEFDTGNPSYHPVEGAGASDDVPSLINNLTTASVIYCTDCHASNGTNAPDGPHGSTYVPILKYNNTTADYTTESETAYALCYSCHSRANILSDVTFSEHYSHVVTQEAPCSTCHDAHGISSTQGTVDENARLMNCNTDIVRVRWGVRSWTSTGYREGYCWVNCHGSIHNQRTYP